MSRVHNLAAALADAARQLEPPLQTDLAGMVLFPYTGQPLHGSWGIESEVPYGSFVPESINRRPIDELPSRLS